MGLKSKHRKKQKKKRVGAHSLIHSTSKVGGRVRALGMGLEQTHKRKFKMGLTCTTKRKGRLVQIEWKWCDGLNRDNLKHKFYTAGNLWKEAPLPSLKYIMCLSMGTTSKCHFSSGLSSVNLKTGILVVSKL